MLKIKLLSVFVSATILLCPLFSTTAVAKIAPETFQPVTTQDPTLVVEQQDILTDKTPQDEPKYRAENKINWQKTKQKCFDIAKGAIRGIVQSVPFSIIIVTISSFECRTFFLSIVSQLLINLIGGVTCGLIGTL